MKTVSTLCCKCRRTGTRLCTLVVLFVGSTSATRGDPPIDPLPAPLFSFDLNSPKVLNESVDGDAMLAPVPPDLDTVFAGWVFGLGISTDDLDAISMANADVPPDALFALLFSVSADTVGIAAPDPHFVSMDVPYNALDQALRGQAAGDQFMSTKLWSRDGTRGSVAAVELLNNVLVRNNFDEGGTDFVASPDSSAIDIFEGEPQDCVDATAVLLPETDAIYFTVSTGSPSLTGLHGRPYPSGADVFAFTPPEGGSRAKSWLKDRGIEPAGTPFDQTCQSGCRQTANETYDNCINGGGTVEECAASAHEVLTTCLWVECGITPPPPPGLYVSALDLGLRQCDDIDAMTVFDTNADGLFNGSDKILFSLTPESLSLTTLPGASVTGAAADVFVMSPGAEGPTLFASAADLGLGHPDDNIDALDFTLCEDVDTCAAAHGIRTHQSIPILSAWGVVVMALLMLVAGTVVASQRRSSLVRS